MNSQSIHSRPALVRHWREEADAAYVTAALTSVIGPDGISVYRGPNGYVAASAPRGDFRIGCYFHPDGGFKIMAKQGSGFDISIPVERSLPGPWAVEVAYAIQTALEEAGVPLLP